jgi:hypothetical protein
MLGGVAVFGGVTAADVAAIGTEAQVYPSVAEFHTLFTDVFGGLSDVQVVEMTANG